MNYRSLLQNQQFDMLVKKMRNTSIMKIIPWDDWLLYEPKYRLYTISIIAVFLSVCMHHDMCHDLRRDKREPNLDYITDKKYNFTLQFVEKVS